MKSILRARLVFVSIGVILGVVALVVTAFGVARTFAQPYVVRTSFETVGEHKVEYVLIKSVFFKPFHM